MPEQKLIRQLTRYKKGYPLLEKDTVAEKETKEWCRFVDESGHFVAWGYLGKQNKGRGWLFSWNEAAPTERFFRQLFTKAFEKRTAFQQNPLTDCFRLFNGEGDGLGGITIDDYAGYLVISWYNATIFAHQDELLRALVQAAEKIGFAVQGIYQKERFPGGAEASRIAGSAAPAPLLVKENGVSYAVYLNEGWMTGIFLDQREVRGKLVDGLARGGRVLNTFSYTGAFSLAALMGGAAQTVNVDLAKRSLAKTREQFAINGIDADQEEIRVMDVFAYLKYAAKKELTFDVVILDPPSFARNKKKVFSVAKDYEALVAAAQKLIKNGILIASTNAANMDLKHFRRQVDAALLAAGREYTITETLRLPPDFAVDPHFPEGNYLKVLFIELKEGN